MGSVRAYSSITGFTTSTPFTDLTPSAAADLVDKEYVDGNSVTFTVANNQSSAANVTGVSLSSASFVAAKILFRIVRTDATPTRYYEMGHIYLLYRAATNDWAITVESFGDDAGVTFSVTSGGQLQYTSTNMAGGSYSGTSNFKWSNRTSIEA